MRSEIQSCRRAVRFCGGCNPWYDRMVTAERLYEKLGERLGAVEEGVYYDEVFLICGCAAQCVTVSDIRAEKLTYIFKKIE